ncbi:MAG: triose-phosphate isomerase [Deltaproteobacteria bacterium]|nr:triose-phosphate isomerase [Deltaproteobacteria bacterium]MBW2129720.1 triose-phosphate isomerase [Deltaproteobacteria bacterium]MBW2305196.1 triose-phosphate isomerase [Deltaproteobacteria bacterium]
MNGRRPMIAGNWKMHLGLEEASRLAADVAKGASETPDVDILVAPSFTNLWVVRKAVGDSEVFLGAQNMHWEPKGAFTGEVSPGMLLESGCTHVILGHSERRTLFGETDEMVDKKAGSAVKAGLVPIVCIGETLGEREAGRTSEVIRTQLEGSLKRFREDGEIPSTFVLAYEPVWAIGTGRTASPDQAQEVHGFIREWLGVNFGREAANSVRILYGGSVKPDNIKALMAQPDIDGALVGGASLDAESFLSIVRFGED